MFDWRTPRASAVGEVSSTYSPNDSAFYLTGKVVNVSSGTKVRAEYYYLDSEGEGFVDDAQVEIDESRYVYFPFTKLENTPWAVGSWQVRIFLNGKNVENVSFSVESSIG